MVGTRRLFVRCFLVSLMQVWSLWKATCACEGSVCHLFAKLFLGHGVFICVSMMCFFFTEAVSQMVSPRSIGCVILTPHSGSEALCSRFSVFFHG